MSVIADILVCCEGSVLTCIILFLPSCNQFMVVMAYRVGSVLTCIVLLQAYIVIARFDEYGNGYKTYEVSGRPIQYHLCGDQIYYAYVHLCFRDYDKKGITKKVTCLNGRVPSASLLTKREG
jgi:hypothetical protein